MRTQNIVYSVQAPGAPEQYASGLGTFTIATNNHNLSTSTGTIRLWVNGAAPNSAPAATLSGASYVQGEVGGYITLNVDNIETALAAAASAEVVWHYSLFMTHTGNQVHVCSGYLVRMIP
jgi:hypothetical protein